MNLTTMIQRVHRGLGDRANDIGDAEITDYLNSVWQFQIPEFNPGFLREETFTLSLVNGQTVYNVDNEAAFAGRCRTVLEQMYYDDGEFLHYITDQYIFYSRWPLDDLGSGRPTEVLSYGREIRVNMDPDQTYTLYVTATAYQSPLTDTGLANENYALAVVRGAVRDMAGDLGYDEIAQRFAALYDQAIRRMTSQTSARPPGEIRRTKDF